MGSFIESAGDKMSKECRDPFEEELLDIANEYQLSVRFDAKTGAVVLYEHLGEWECAEQAVLFLKKSFESQED